MISYTSSSECRISKVRVFWIAFFLLLGIFGTLNYLSLTFCESDTRQKAVQEFLFWNGKVKASPQYPVLFLGDSRTYRGIQPAAVDAVLGLKSYNLGFSSGGLNQEMFAHANKKLDRSSSPSVIVMGITPLTLSERARSNEHYHSVLRKSGDLPPTQKFGLHTLFFPMNAERWHTIRHSFRKKERSAQSDILYQDGWMSVPNRYSEAGQQGGLEVYRAWVRDNRFSPDSLAELAAAIKAWRAEGCFVFAFRPPTSRDMIQVEKVCFDEVLVKKTVQDAGGIYLEFPEEDYQTYDASHLTRESAMRFSRDLAAAMKKYMIPEQSSPR